MGNLMEDLAYSVERAYPVSIQTLWEAWADPKALEVWYSPTELKVIPGSVASEVHPGGLWTVGVDVSQYGFNAYFFGSYTEVVEHKKLVHTMNYTQSLEEFNARVETADHHVIVLDFEERGSGSWVRFSQFGVLPEGEAEQAKAGMESYLDNLGKYLSQNS
jgi:uncharacterized protein YndB with AHSA1/START domain